jgi:hypothetical protein
MVSCPGFECKARSLDQPLWCTDQLDERLLALLCEHIYGLSTHKSARITWYILQSFWDLMLLAMNICAFCEVKS